jgi:hypothetical protein
MESLSKLWKFELHKICETLSLRANGTIAELIRKIHNVNSKDSDERTLYMDKIKKSTSPKTRNMNEFYAENFNGVDLSDGIWNEFDYCFIMKDWMAKYMWITTKHALLNTFALYFTGIKK